MTRSYESTEIRHQQIAEAALTVIAEQGLSRFTSRVLAEQVGLTDGSLFRHFRNKEEIVLAAIDALEALMFEGPEEIPEDPLERLESIFRHRASLVGARGSVGRLIFSNELAQVAGEAGQEKMRRLRDRNLRHFAECIRVLREAGHIKIPLETMTIVQVIQGQLLTFGALHAFDDALSPDELRHRIDLSWATLKILLLR